MPNKLCLISLSLLTLICSANASNAQVVYSQSQHVHVNNWSPYRLAWCDPYYAMSARVHAQANLVRANGEFAMHNAVARRVHADAVAHEIENHKAYVAAYYDSKLIRERKRIELEGVAQVRMGLYMNRVKARNGRRWERLDALNGPATAENLNFILERLNVTLLSDDLESPKVFSDEMLAQLHLSRKTLSGLQFRTATHGDSYLRFYADNPVGLSMASWPFLLRDEQFTKMRAGIEKLRNVALRESESSGQVKVKTLMSLENAVADLSQAFHRKYKSREWVVKEMRRFRQYRDAERCLIDLDRQVVRVQNTGDIRAYRGRSKFDPAEHDENLLSLLRFMVDNGLKFNKPLPGEESAYQEVMRKLRSLYRLTAPTDSGIHPVNLLESAN